MSLAHAIHLQPAPSTGACEALILRAAEVLHEFGTPAHRCEERIAALATSLGVVAHASFTPTTLHISFGEGPHIHTVVRRVQPCDIDLGRLVEANHVLDRILDEDLPPARAHALLDQVAADTGGYGGWTLVGAYSLTCACAAALFGGGMVELGVSAAIGVVLAVLAALMRGHSRLAPLFEPFAAFTASALAYSLAYTWIPHAAGIVALASLIALVPGLSFTLAMVELATRHLVSGTARLAGAGATFLTIAFGVALGRSLAATIFAGSTAAIEGIPLPQWAPALAVVAGALSFGVLFNAGRRELVWVVAAGAVGTLAAHAGVHVLGQELGPFVGALALGLLANLYANGGRRPSLVILIPGILLLVPGSIGFRALDLLLAHDVVAGIQTGFDMLLVATALSAGLLVANGLLPNRRGL